MRVRRDKIKFGVIALESRRWSYGAGVMNTTFSLGVRKKIGKKIFRNVAIGTLTVVETYIMYILAGNVPKISPAIRGSNYSDNPEILLGRLSSAIGTIQVSPLVTIISTLAVSYVSFYLHI
ncbi:hypothetical protein BJ944DRAFT_234047 [Cunninghamella echinulata]|nr:hypothetical protein BJ944DRAFT_234047 [Cunninghamella echinulata]